MNRRKFIWLVLASALMCSTPALTKEPPPAKVKCMGITKAGKPCKRTVKPPNVFCYSHKAQAADPKHPVKRFNVPGCTTDMECEQKFGPAYRE